jgi:hypothetical protein
MHMALKKGRPIIGSDRMKKTSIALPEILIERLGEGAKKSGFRHWSEQARYELMQPRGMWKAVQPYLPTQAAPEKA